MQNAQNHISLGNADTVDLAIITLDDYKISVHCILMLLFENIKTFDNVLICLYHICEAIFLLVKRGDER